MADVTIDQLTPRQPTAAAILPFMNSGVTDANNATSSQASSVAFPVGFIGMWSGSTVPAGWYICDGTNGTPDLRNQFIIGSSQDNAGQSVTTVTGSNTKTGGAADAVNVSHTHTASMPHVHSGQVTSVSVATFSVSNGSVAGPIYSGMNAGSTGSAAPAVTINSQGSSGANANLPPYYALAYIMKA